MGQHSIQGFLRVVPTSEELTEWHKRSPYRPSVFRVQCDACGKRIWGSGIGIGSHRRACKGKEV